MVTMCRGSTSNTSRRLKNEAARSGLILEASVPTNHRIGKAVHASILGLPLTLDHLHLRSKSQDFANAARLSPPSAYRSLRGIILQCQ